MSTLGTIGRILYALPMLVFGSFHFMRGADMAGMVPVPGDRHRRVLRPSKHRG